MKRFSQFLREFYDTEAEKRATALDRVLADGGKGVQSYYKLTARHLDTLKRIHAGAKADLEHPYFRVDDDQDAGMYAAHLVGQHTAIEAKDPEDRAIVRRVVRDALPHIHHAHYDEGIEVGDAANAEMARDRPEIGDMGPSDAD